MVDEFTQSSQNKQEQKNVELCFFCKGTDGLSLVRCEETGTQGEYACTACWKELSHTIHLNIAKSVTPALMRMI